MKGFKVGVTHRSTFYGVRGLSALKRKITGRREKNERVNRLRSESNSL